MPNILDGFIPGTPIPPSECPFKEKPEPADEEAEGIADDDRDEVIEVQKNNGGVLGENLIASSPGKAGTVKGPVDPPTLAPQLRKKTEADDTLKVWVLGAEGIPDGHYACIQAAHHLIPGNAALKPSKLVDYMTKGKTIESETTGKKWTIQENIGYNVNGNHNGVWLPGNYAIRSTTSPLAGQSWRALAATKTQWCMNYVAAACMVGEGTFHDAHTEYSSAVEEMLNKIHTAVLNHQDGCDECQKKTEIPPPYIVKQRLFNLSNALKGKVTSTYMAWKRPWFTSDKWREPIFGSSGSPEAWAKALDFTKLKSLT